MNPSRYQKSRYRRLHSRMVDINFADVSVVNSAMFYTTILLLDTPRMYYTSGSCVKQLATHVHYKNRLVQTSLNLRTSAYASRKYGQWYGV
jgi:hypothetical protein